MTGILIYSESEEAALGLLTKGRELAKELNLPLSVALLENTSDDTLERYFSHGAAKVYVGENPNLADFQASTYATALAQVVTQSESDIILIGATRRGRELAPRLAQKLAAGCLTDATRLWVENGQLVTERRALGGNTVASQTIISPYQVISVMPKLYEPEPGETVEGELVPITLELDAPKTRVLQKQPKEAGSVNLEEADVLVCVGRGVGSKDDLELIDSLARELGGMVGCTRPISHDYHWLTEDQMVGLSGKESSPELYVAIGVSGQIQHTVGILNAKTILAINNDSNAPIFKIADYGIVGDLYQVIPMLIERLQNG